MKPPKRIKDADVKRLWVSLWPKLEAADMVDELSADAFEMLCSAIVKWRRSNAACLAYGDDQTYVIPNGSMTSYPEFKMCENFEKAMKDILKEFGLTPKSAKDLGINIDGDSEETEAFENL